MRAIRETKLGPGGLAGHARLVGCVLVCATVVLIAACRNQPGVPRPAPPPAPTSPSPPPPAPPPTPVTLFGTIFELAPDGTRRPLAARQVSIEVEVPTVTDPSRGGWVPVGANGRYRLSGVPDGHFVKIPSVDLTGIRDPNRYRQCATNELVTMSRLSSSVLPASAIR